MLVLLRVLPELRPSHGILTTDDFKLISELFSEVSRVEYLLSHLVLQIFYLFVNGSLTEIYLPLLLSKQDNFR